MKKRPFLKSFIIFSFQRIVRDDRFHSRQLDRSKNDISKRLQVDGDVEKRHNVDSGGAEADEESWMTVQVLAAVHPLNTLSDEHQQEILKVSTFLYKKWVNPASFLFIFGLFKQTSLQFLQQIYVKKCPSSIRCWNLNPQPSEHEPPPITTRPVHF